MDDREEFERTKGIETLDDETVNKLVITVIVLIIKGKRR